MGCSMIACVGIMGTAGESDVRIFFLLSIHSEANVFDPRGIQAFLVCDVRPTRDLLFSISASLTFDPCSTRLLVRPSAP